MWPGVSITSACAGPERDLVALWSPLDRARQPADISGGPHDGAPEPRPHLVGPSDVVSVMVRRKKIRSSRPPARSTAAMQAFASGRVDQRHGAGADFLYQPCVVVGQNRNWLRSHCHDMDVASGPAAGNRFRAI